MSRDGERPGGLPDEKASGSTLLGQTADLAPSLHTGLIWFGLAGVFLLAMSQSGGERGPPQLGHLPPARLTVLPLPSFPFKPPRMDSRGVCLKVLSLGVGCGFSSALQSC